ncbi:ATP dependent DNA ligase [Caballeronia arvi]|uniref:ATP dependent DNA ligase n=1 Tax=Caballeronia arvi TaxID=1777135 RepID=A0A158L3E3_9BURK|nr:ATP dependent DNA ligase [Caballeronia arvi]
MTVSDKRVGVSMPIAWDELTDIGRADQWTIKTAAPRMHSRSADPWDGFHRTRQGITVAMRRAVGLRRPPLEHTVSYGSLTCGAA